jgi:O-antigen/teichoic acid export membrane protein
MVHGGILKQLRPRLRSELGMRLAVATVSSGGIWAAGTLATFGVGVVLARSLGPNGYGIYGTAIAVVTLLTVPAQIGLPLLAIREVSAARVHGRLNEAAALGWYFVVAVVTLAGALAIALWLASRLLKLAPALQPALAAAAWLLIPLALSGLAIGLLRGQARVLVSQLLDVLVRPLAFGALLLALPRTPGAAEAIGAQALAAGAIALIALGLFFGRLPLGFRHGPHRLRAWAMAALPMTILEALRVLDGSYAVLVASYAAGLADAGLLRVAMASSMVVSAPISLQNNVVGPYLAAAHAAGETQRMSRIMAGSALFMTGSVAAVTVAIVAAGQWALPLAFGPAFSGAYWPLVVLCLNQLLAALFGNGATLLAMTGHERVVVRALAASVLAAVLAALLLTPWLGVAGTAAAALVATTIRGIMLNRAARRLLGVDPSLLGAAMLLGGGTAATPR